VKLRKKEERERERERERRKKQQKCKRGRLLRTDARRNIVD
jgi:hypothetical protein